MTISSIAGGAQSEREIRETVAAIRSVARTVATLRIKETARSETPRSAPDGNVVAAETLIAAQSAQSAAALPASKAYPAAAAALKSAVLLRLI